MYVYLARHAWAGRFGDPGWDDDSERPLTGPGKQRYRRVIETLVPRGFVPAHIATSPYVRCRQTADIVAEYTGGRITQLEALEPGSQLDELLEWTNHHREGDVCWVGHNPDMGRLAARLLGDARSNLRFAKGSVAAIRFHGRVEEGAGELFWLATAKLLGV